MWFEFGAPRGRAPILPNDGSVQRLAGAPIPRDNSLSLVGDTDRRDRSLDRARDLVENRDREPPDLACVVLDPPWTRIVLRQFAIRARERMALVIDDERAYAAGPSVDRDHGHAGGQRSVRAERRRPDAHRCTHRRW